MTADFFLNHCKNVVRFHPVKITTTEPTKKGPQIIGSIYHDGSACAVVVVFFFHLIPACCPCPGFPGAPGWRACPDTNPRGDQSLEAFSSVPERWRSCRRRNDRTIWKRKTDLFSHTCTRRLSLLFSLISFFSSFYYIVPLFREKRELITKSKLACITY